MLVVCSLYKVDFFLFSFFEEFAKVCFYTIEFVKLILYKLILGRYSLDDDCFYLL